MSDERKNDEQGGGIRISSGRDTTIDRAVLAARDAYVDMNISEGTDLAEVKGLFDVVFESIETADLVVDKSIVKTTVEQIEEEVVRPEEGQPDEGKIERLMRTLKAMAPDIFDVAITTFANPPAGVALVIKRIGDKIQAEAG